MTLPMSLRGAIKGQDLIFARRVSVGKIITMIQAIAYAVRRVDAQDTQGYQGTEVYKSQRKGVPMPAANDPGMYEYQQMMAKEMFANAATPQPSVPRKNMTELRASITTSVQLPCYQSHKKVWALKIKEITNANPPTIAELEEILRGEQFHGDEEIVGAMITPEEEGYGAFPVSRRYMLKHAPQVGGYYVVYADGYESWSPAEAFDEGYTRI